MWLRDEPDRGLPTILELSPAELGAARASGRPIAGRELAGTDTGRLCVLGPYGEAAVDDAELLAALADAGHGRILEHEVVVAYWDRPRLRLSSFGRDQLEYGNSTADPPAAAVLVDACTETSRARLYVTDAGLFFGQAIP